MSIFYAGSYTQEDTPAIDPAGKGIACLKLNKRSGKIELLHYTKQRNPSYLAVSRDKGYLYALEEMYKNLEPRIFSYAIGENGKLRVINSQPLEGDYACHLAIIRDRLVIANYMSGDVLSFIIREDGSLAPAHQKIQHSGQGPNKERQEAAHAHMIYPYKRNSMYVLDLGLDKAKAYDLDPKSKEWIARPQRDLEIDPGAGARHMVMDHGQEYAYLLSELSGEIFVIHCQKEGHSIIQKISFVPGSFAGPFGGAAIRLHPGGRFLYASLRGSDTIAVFEIDAYSKRLSLITYQSTRGETPRDFNIDPGGSWLIAANQDSNSLVVFEVNPENGKLKYRSAMPLETPVNICWL